MTKDQEEMMRNAETWLHTARDRLPFNIGAIFIFFPKNAVGQAKGVCVGTVPEPMVQREIEAILSKKNEVPLIIRP